MTGNNQYNKAFLEEFKEKNKTNNQHINGQQQANISNIHSNVNNTNQQPSNPNHIAQPTQAGNYSSNQQDNFVNLKTPKPK